MKTLFFKKHFFLAIIVIFLTGCGGVIDAMQQSYYNQKGNSYFKDKEYVPAFNAYRDGAVEGSAYAYYKLYVMYLNGYGVQKDLVQSNKMLEEAARRNYAPAQVILANRLIFTTKRNRDMNRGLALLNSAASQEYSYAYADLYTIYWYGIGVKKDIQKAGQYYRLAQANGLKLTNRAFAADTTNSTVLISQIQAGLKKLGFYKGEVDGLTGPMTRRSIVQFQKFYGYTQNSQATKLTLDQIKRELSRR